MKSINSSNFLEPESSLKTPNVTCAPGLEVSQLLAMCTGSKRLQKTIFAFVLPLAFSHAIIAYGIFYIFYPPDYRCQDAQGELYACSRSEACADGQAFVLDDSKPDQRSGASTTCWTCRATGASWATTRCSSRRRRLSA